MLHLHPQIALPTRAWRLQSHRNQHTKIPSRTILYRYRSNSTQAQRCAMQFLLAQYRTKMSAVWCPVWESAPAMAWEIIPVFRMVLVLAERGFAAEYPFRFPQGMRWKARESTRATPMDSSSVRRQEKQMVIPKHSVKTKVLELDHLLQRQTLRARSVPVYRSI